MEDARGVREEYRLQALHDLNILDTLPEAELDEIVELATTICSVPIGLMSLVDRRRQWFKATVGLALRETPIEMSFCAHAIRQPELFVVEDATQDERFADNPLVTGELGVRFYAGFPLTVDGQALGTLCVIDHVPRQLTERQTQALRILARQLEARMEMRTQHRSLEATLSNEKKLGENLRASEALFRAFMNNSPYLCFIKDADGRMVFYNTSFATQLGVTMDECLGKLDHELWPAAQAREFRKHDLEVLAGGVRVEYDEQLTGRDGRMFYFHSTKFPYEDGTGKKLLAGVAVDVTHEVERNAELARYQAELVAANRQLRQLAVTDALTGLKNRRAFSERLEVEYTVARRVGRDLSVILIDIDHFKRVNDMYGHAAGDEVLCELSRVLEATVRNSDLAVRYGGEEFAVLLPDSNLTQTLRCAERFREALREARFAHGPVTVSMGVAGIADGTNGEAMVACADEALYAAKRSGRDAIVAFSRCPERVGTSEEESHVSVA